MLFLIFGYKLNVVVNILIIYTLMIYEYNYRTVLRLPLVYRCHTTENYLSGFVEAVCSFNISSPTLSVRIIHTVLLHNNNTSHRKVIVALDPVR